MYESDDFKVTRNKATPENPFSFTTKSKCKKGWVSANFFWKPSNVTMRIIGDKIPCMEIAYPFVNHNGGGVLADMAPQELLRTLVNRLNIQVKNQ